MGEIRKGISFRDKLTHRERWNTWREYYRGKYSPNTMPQNLYFKMLRTMIPRVYFRNPQVSITPRKNQQDQIDYLVLAMLLERMDNSLLDHIKFKHTMKAAIQDAFMFSTGFIKLGYGGEFNPKPAIGDVTEAPSDDRGFTVEYNSLVQPDTPWALRVPTGNLVVPAGTADWASTRWVAHKIRRHVDDVQADDRFKHVKDLAPGVIPVPGESADVNLKDMVDLYEIRDKKSGHVFVLAPSGDNKVLFDDVDSLQYDRRLNYFPIQFNADDEFFWGVPDAYILEPHQVEANQIRTMIMKHRRVSIIKWMVKNGALNPDNITKLNSDEVNAVIGLNDDFNMNDVKELQASDIPNGLLKSDAIVGQNVQEILGLGVNQFGEYAPGSADRSATEAMIVNQAVQIRTDERRDIVADAVTDFVEHLNYVILNEWRGNKKVVDIIGPEGEKLWVAFDGSDISSLDYDVKVDMDSAIPQTRQVRAANAQKIYAGYAQNPLMDLNKLTRWSLSEQGGAVLTDLMKQGPMPGQAGAAPALPAGTPGSGPQNPMAVGQVIQHLMQKKGAANG